MEICFSTYIYQYLPMTYTYNPSSPSTRQFAACPASARPTINQFEFQIIDFQSATISPEVLQRYVVQ